MSIAELSIKRPVTAIMLFVSMVVIGVIAAVRLPLEAMPDVSAPLLFVQIPYAGSTPEEVERNILRPVEETLSTMTDIKSMRGTAPSESASVFMIFSDWDRDIEIAASMRSAASCPTTCSATSSGNGRPATSRRSSCA